MLSVIIGDSYNKSIGDFYYANIDNRNMNSNMKYPDFARRLTLVWKDCADAPEKQTPLAKWLGFSQPTVNDWLNGKGLPSLDTAIKLADKFGVCVEWLITGKGQKSPGDPPDLRNVIDVTHLSPDQIQAVKLIIAQFEQTNPPKYEQKLLTAPAENAGGAAEQAQQPKDQDRRVANHQRFMKNLHGMIRSTCSSE